MDSNFEDIVEQPWHEQMSTGIVTVWLCLLSRSLQQLHWWRPKETSVGWIQHTRGRFFSETDCFVVVWQLDNN